MIFNLKKKEYNLDILKKELDKKYAYYYHVNCKTAHLNRIGEFFIAPRYTSAVKEYINKLNLEPTIIDRPFCQPCVVKYQLYTYKRFLDKLVLNNINQPIINSFIIGMANNIK